MKNNISNSSVYLKNKYILIVREITALFLIQTVFTSKLIQSIANVFN